MFNALININIYDDDWTKTEWMLARNPLLNIMFDCFSWMKDIMIVVSSIDPTSPIIRSNMFIICLNTSSTEICRFWKWNDDNESVKNILFIISFCGTFKSFYTRIDRFGADRYCADRFGAVVLANVIYYIIDLLRDWPFFNMEQITEIYPSKNQKISCGLKWKIDCKIGIVAVKLVWKVSINYI